jgi:hypothetical protein
LAAFRGALNNRKRAGMMSSRGKGSIAVRTASSTRSNSTSLMAHSPYWEARSQISFVAGLPGSLKFYRSADPALFGY